MLEPYMVLDFTDERGEIGPMILGDLGAQVIKIELPEGASSRRTAPFYKGSHEASDLSSLQFIAYNRNKRSITIDPNSDEDRSDLDELIRRADIIFESAPNGILAALNFDFARVAALNPKTPKPPNPSEVID